jgi:hypothetical protein
MIMHERFEFCDDICPPDASVYQMRETRIL